MGQSNGVGRPRKDAEREIIAVAYATNPHFSRTDLCRKLDVSQEFMRRAIMDAKSMSLEELHTRIMSNMKLSLELLSRQGVRDAWDVLQGKSDLSTKDRFAVLTSMARQLGVGPSEGAEVNVQVNNAVVVAPSITEDSDFGWKRVEEAQSDN